MIHIKKGQWSLAMICVILGLMMAVQFRITQDNRTSIHSQRLGELSNRLVDMEKERDALAQEVHELRQKGGANMNSKELEMLKNSAGVTALKGQGVVITIDDSKRPVKPGENPNLYLIHDDDILKVINELWAAGAEAISINDQRLITTSEIRCAGPTMSVNNTRYSPPYIIRAIGKAETLSSALKMRGGVIETLQFWGIQITVKNENEVEVPAYKGAFRFEYATPDAGGASK